MVDSVVHLQRWPQIEVESVRHEGQNSTWLFFVGLVVNSSEKLTNSAIDSTVQSFPGNILQILVGNVPGEFTCPERREWRGVFSVF